MSSKQPQQQPPLRQAVKQRTTGDHRGFGKVILFGEHVVVHGAPAIVAGVSEYTSCQLEVTPGKPGWVVADDRPAIPGYKVEKAEEQRKAHELVFNHNRIDLSKNGLRVHLAGPLVPTSGIGASASDVVSLSRALSELYDLRLDEAAVNHSAFVGEGGYHGTPSGVDNTAATYGGLLIYQRNPQTKQSKFSRIPCRSTLYIVVIGTGMTSSTTQVVADVGKLAAAKPEWFAGLLGQYKAIYDAAMTAIAKGDIAGLGVAMNRCHSLCQQLTISCPELDAIVESARSLGALGAKMSGTGRGGIAVAICADAASQKRVAAQLLQSCPAAKFTWAYSVKPQASSKL